MSDILWSYDHAWGAEHLGSPEWESVLDWFRGQGIDPYKLPASEDLSIVDSPDGLLLRYSLTAEDKNGQIILCGHGGGDEHPFCRRTSKIVDTMPPAPWVTSA